MGEGVNALSLAREFWRLMATNDFFSVSAVLADDFVAEWPQSRERIRGAEHYARINADYPANGPWRFEVHRVVGGEAEAVTDVTFTDGVQTARVISFFTVANGRITRMVEYFPDPYDPPANRAHLVERMA